MLTGWARPSGRRVLAVLGVFVGLFVVSSIGATVFWSSTGGVGILDIDGGANLFQPDTARPFPPKGTGLRVLAILASYDAGARLAHIVMTCTLDLLLPLSIAALCWVGVVWAWGRARWVRVAAGTLAIAYLLVDWGENCLELYLLAGGRGAAVDVLPVVSQLKLVLFALVAAASIIGVVTRWLRRRTRVTIVET